MVATWLLLFAWLLSKAKNNHNDPNLETLIPALKHSVVSMSWQVLFLTDVMEGMLVLNSLVVSRPSILCLFHRQVTLTLTLENKEPLYCHSSSKNWKWGLSGTYMWMVSFPYCHYMLQSIFMQIVCCQFNLRSSALNVACLHLT